MAIVFLAIVALGGLAITTVFAPPPDALTAAEYTTVKVATDTVGTSMTMSTSATWPATQGPDRWQVRLVHRICREVMAEVARQSGYANPTPAAMAAELGDFAEGFADAILGLIF